MESALKRTFAAFHIRNFRLFMYGQGISLCGNWVQVIAISWLVLKLTGSGTQLGFITAAQFLPNLLIGLWGGLIADRFNKLHVLYITQSLFGLLAFLLGLLVITNSVHLWMVYVIAVGFGVIQVVDNPTRQSFVIEMVGRERIKNAVNLNSTLVNVARIIGPSIAGILIATVGIGQCFIVNALSFVAVIIALTRLDKSQLRAGPTSTKEPGQIRAGLAYIMGEPMLKSTLLMMFITGTFVYEFPVIIPLFATVTMHGNASTYATMMSALGLGAIAGALYSASQTDFGETGLIKTALIFGLVILVVSVAPSFVTALLALVIMGSLSVTFITLGNTILQLTSRDDMRGRVMAVWAVAFFGTTPIGGPIIGFISDHSSPRWALATGGLSAIIAAILGFYIYKNSDRKLVV